MWYKLVAVYQGIRKFFRKQWALIMVLFFAGLFFVAWYRTAKIIRVSDLYLNLAAGFCTTGLMIFFVDRIVDKHKQEDNLPMRMAMYRDIQIFTSRLISLWADAYFKTSSNDDELPIKTMFSAEVMEPVFYSLDMETFPDVFPKQDWFSYLTVAFTDLTNSGKDILRFYVNIITPDMYEVIHYLITDSSLTGLSDGMMLKIHNVDIQRDFPRLAVLCSYLPIPSNRDYKAISDLVDWCSAEYNCLRVYGEYTNIYPIAKVAKNVNSNTCGTCAITQEKIDKYNECVKKRK